MTATLPEAPTSGRVGGDRRGALLDVALLVLLAVVAVAPFGRLFANYWVLAWAGGAALIAAGVVVALSPRRWFVVSLAANLVAIACYLVFGLFHIGIPAASGISSVWRATTSSWANLLTTTLPAKNAAGLFALPVLAAWFASFAGVELARRFRWAVAPALPAIPVFTLALLFTGHRSAGDPIVSFLLVVLLLVLVLVRSNRTSDASKGESAAVSVDAEGNTVRERRPQVRLGAAVIVVLGALAVLAGTVSGVVHDDDRRDLRNDYAPPANVTDAVSPLARLRGALNDTSNRVLFTVTFRDVPGDVVIDRIPIAILDSYDGAVWSSDAAFRSLGAEVPRGEVSKTPTAPVRQEYSIGDYRSAFLPAMERPTSITGAPLAFDPDSGMIISNQADKSHLHYAVVSNVALYPFPDTNRSDAAAEVEHSLGDVKAGNDPVAAALSLPPAALGAWPPDIQRYAASPQFSTGNPYAVLKGIEADLKSRKFGYSPRARAGHSLGVLKSFLVAAPATTAAAPGGAGAGPADSVVRVGSAEQFAAAFAVLARAKGYPSRVVVGYRVKPDAVAKGDPIVVKNPDMHAWAEVNLNGYGWVPFDPTDATKADKPLDETTTPTTAPKPQDDTVPPSSVDQAPTTQSSAAACAGAAASDPACKRGSGDSAFPLWLILLLAVLLSTPATIVLAKRARRERRKTKGTEADRVIGALREVRDHLSGHGGRTSNAMTVAELSRSLMDRAGPDACSRLAELGPIVDTALYAEEHPDEEMVTAAWRVEEGVAAALNEGSSPVRRLGRRLDPRPLIGSQH